MDSAGSDYGGAGDASRTACPRDRLHDLERRLVAKAVDLGAHTRCGAWWRRRWRARMWPGMRSANAASTPKGIVAWKEDHTGMVTLPARLDAVTAAPIRTVIEQMVTQQFRARRDQDPSAQDQRTAGQMRADALFELCRHALGCKDTDHRACAPRWWCASTRRELEAGRGLGRIDGIDQPVSVGAAAPPRGGCGHHPGGAWRRQRGARPGPHQDGCSPGHSGSHSSNATADAPSVTPRPNTARPTTFAGGIDGGGTDLANGVMLCTRCHHDVHRQGWDIRVERRPSQLHPATRHRPRAPRYARRTRRARTTRPLAACAHVNWQT